MTGSAIAADKLDKPAPGIRDAGARVAVVIRNCRDPSGALENPKNDATVMAAALRRLGFDVELKIDATKSDLDGILKRLGKIDSGAGLLRRPWRSGQWR
ncbi:caspase family protein [Propionivibrio dicarboxylicus]|uniref:caspase family protein n=1 Tax=Propionivibrio dicarboxylicus TaxID=83767 RepID=UPI00115F9DE2